MFAISKEQYLAQMFNEWANEDRDGLYHDTQILLAYNSNRIEGSSITENDTRGIFETTSNAERVPDGMAIANHFVAFNEILNTIDDIITPEYLKWIHSILMYNTEDSQDPDFILGDWRRTPVFAGAKPFVSPNEIDAEIEKLLASYSTYPDFTAINHFHGEFENIHPFSNGNGRIGRLIHFKECVRNDITPCIVFDNDKETYYNGIEMFNMNPNILQQAFAYYQSLYENILLERLDTGVY